MAGTGGDRHRTDQDLAFQQEPDRHGHVPGAGVGVAELARRVVAPAVGLVERHDAAGMRAADGQLGEDMAVGDGHRHVAGLVRAVADLTLGVGAPAVGAARAVQRTGVEVPDADRHERRGALDGGRRGRVHAFRVSQAELTLEVRSPAPHDAFVVERAAMTEPAGHLHEGGTVGGRPLAGGWLQEAVAAGGEQKTGHDQRRAGLSRSGMVSTRNHDVSLVLMRMVASEPEA